MSDEGTGTLETTPETPSEKPEDMTGTPPETVDVDDPDHVEVPGADGAELSGEGEGTTEEESEGWKALKAKWPGKTDAEVKTLAADQFWEAKNHASRTTRENVELREALDQTQGPPEPDEPEDPPTHPQVEELDARIQGLRDNDQAVQKKSNATLIELTKADKSIAQAEARRDDAKEALKNPNLEEWARVRKESAVDTFEARIEAAQAKRQAIITTYEALQGKRDGFSSEVARLMTDKDWLTKVAKQQAATQKSEKESADRFNTDFPRQLDDLITKSADGQKVPEEDRVRKSLWVHVNRAMMVELMGLGKADVDRLNLKEMVNGYVQEFVDERDFSERRKFEERSKKKREVAKRTVDPKAVPPAKRPPVPPSLMSTGDTSPAMLRARKYLNTKGL